MATTTTILTVPTTSVVDAGINSRQSLPSTRPTPSYYLTIDGLLKSHASEDVEIPLVGYPASGIDDYEIHTAKALDRYVDAACWWYQRNGLEVAVSGRLSLTWLLETDHVRIHRPRKLLLLHFLPSRESMP